MVAVNKNEKSEIIFQNRSKVNINIIVELIREKWTVCVIGLLVGLFGGVLNYSVISTPRYQATSMVYVRSSNKRLSFDSLQLTSSLTSDYKIIFVSEPNLKQIIKELHLKYNVDQLNNLITIDNPDDTRILKVTVKSKSAVEARNIANSVIKYGMDDIREIDSQEPFVIQKATTKMKRIGLSLIEMIVIGGIIGLLIVIFIIVLLDQFKDSFRSVNDVEESLDIPVLAVIAEDQSLAYAKLESSNSRRRKHHGKKTSK